MSQPSSRRISPPHFRRGFAVPGTATQIGTASSAPLLPKTDATSAAKIATKMKTSNIVDVSSYQSVCTAAITKTTTIITTPSATTESIVHLSGKADGGVITTTPVAVNHKLTVGNDNNNTNFNTNTANHNISQVSAMRASNIGRNIPSSCPDSPIRRVSTSLKNSAFGFATRFFNKCKAATFTVDGATYTIGNPNANQALY
ncbi:uncharacterized protein [Eurosta solidaginis]|uniref:uncharacterized protein n=1 Tax=Eurosta solidaginis TaxID=178769 RepID=UPI0035309E7C